MEELNRIQHINRSAGLGGTDAMRIMRGEWLPLYQEKLGLKQPDDLSGVFRVQLGIRSERFHREWFTKMTGLEVTDIDSMLIHEDHDFMFANCDGWVPDDRTFIEFKHSSNAANLQDKARYYMPQLQHYMAVLGVKYCWFSVIRGNDEPVFAQVERDDNYIEQLIKMEQSFWWHVQHQVPPDISPKGELTRIAKDVERIKVGGYRISDMTSNNSWADAASRFITTQDAAKQHESAKKDLKDLVDEDVVEAYGHGLVIKRDKRNALTIRLAKEA